MVGAFLLSAVIVTLAQNDGGAISGQVVDATGARIGATDLQLEPATPGSLAKVLSDERGNFLFPNVSPGRYILSLTAPGFQFSYRVVEVVPGSSTTLGRLTLQVGMIGGYCDPYAALAPEIAKIWFVRDERLGRLSGTVVDDRGGLRKAMLTLRESKGGVAAVTQSEADGTYLFREVRPGRYRIWIESPKRHLPVQSSEFEVVDDVDLLFSEVRLERKIHPKRPEPPICL
jgi:Carboxypeptidase regulatory-like domain